MDMGMSHGLASKSTVIQANVEGGDAQFLLQAVSYVSNKPPEVFLLSSIQVENAYNVLLRNNERVPIHNWITISERGEELILEVNPVFGHRTEWAALRHTSLQGRFEHLRLELAAFSQ
jgi:hypothetical protein